MLKFEKQLEIPRGYVSTLEAQVKQLKAELGELRKRNPSSTVTTASPTATDADAEGRSDTYSPAGAHTVDSVCHDPQEVVKSMGLVMLESSNQPRFMGTSSGITFAKMVLAAVKGDASMNASLSRRQRGSLGASAPCTAITSSLPPRHAAQHIVDVYFRYRTPHVPILLRSEVGQVLERVYKALECSHNDISKVPEQDLFVAYIVFAVGLCGLPMMGGSRPPQSEGCFNSALGCVDSLLSYSTSSLETLTVVLLLAQYVALNPSKGSLWQLTGMALRLCIDLGLHWETDSVLSMPQIVLEQRRRLFWATYRYDRLLAITLGRPFGIADQSINTKYPDSYDSEYRKINDDRFDADCHDQRVANHVIDLYRLESEIKHVLYHQLQGPTLAYPRANYALWLKDIQPRLRAWQDAIPNLAEAGPESIYSRRSWWDAMWCNAVMLLHRPNPLVANPTVESLQICFDTACRSITAIKTLQREGRISVVWQWVHHVFLAGLTMIYCIWQSSEVRNAACILDVMATTQDCASTLAALSERFTEASGCRDAFESLSAATLKWLVARDKRDRSESLQPTPGNEIHNLRENVPFSSAGWRADAPSSIFPDEPFEFAEYLIAASQWPGTNTDMGAAFNLQGMFDTNNMATT
ncbi:fungal-specific transcription factor domain-containing protein [Whalleya microplaca]|nr:fungal-specific transcription factor domain-containing protein [Whalleya microplaca]